MAGPRPDLHRTPALRRAALEAYRKLLADRCPAMFNPDDVAVDSLARFLRVPAPNSVAELDSNDAPAEIIG